MSWPTRKGTENQTFTSADYAGYLIPEALIDTQSLRAEAVFESKMGHEVGQVNGPHALRELQLPARSLKLLIADRMEVPATPGS